MRLIKIIHNARPWSDCVFYNRLQIGSLHTFFVHYLKILTELGCICQVCIFR